MAPVPVVRVQPALLGREDELDELAAGLEDARMGRGRLFLISGEGGIGKTRLVEALADLAKPTEVRALWGRCWEGGGATPFWPFVQVLRALVDSRPTNRLAHLLGEGAPDLVSLVPEVTQRLPDLAPRLGSDAPDARLRLFDAVTGTFTRASADTGGMIVALEDLHAADEASLLLLRHLAPGIASSHLLVVGTYREAEAQSLPTVHRLLREVGLRDRRMPLSGISEDAVAALLEQQTGDFVTGGLAREIHAATDGNPFFVTEVARLLATDRTRPVGGRATPLQLPEELKVTVARRLQCLPAGGRKVLALAAVLGQEFELPVLTRLAGLGPAALLDVLDAARAASIVEEIAIGRWRFAHALLRESLYETSTPAERADAHHQAARALEELHAAGGPGRVAELAHHCYEAGSLGDPAKAVHYLDAAARDAVSALAFEEAALLWTRSLATLARTSPLDEVKRTEILIALTGALHRAGEYQSARETYHRAVKAGRASGSPDLFARAAVCLPANIYGRTDSARLTALEEANAIVPAAEGGLRALVMVELASAVNMRTRAEGHGSWKQGWKGWQSSEERSLGLLTGALDLVRGQDDSPSLRDVLLRWLVVAGIFDRPVGDPLVADELVRRFGDAGDAEGEARARSYVIRRLLLEGRVGPLGAELERFEKQAHELRLPHLLISAMSARAALSLLQERPDEAAGLARAAYERGQRLELQDVALHFQRRMEVTLGLQGRFTELDQLARRKVRHMPEAMKIECSRVSLAAALVGNSDAAEEGRALFDDMVPGGLEPDVFGAPRACCLVGLADVCWVLGDANGARPLYDRLLPYQGQVAVRGITAPRGVTDRYLGQLATLLARYEEAEAHFNEAHRRQAAMGARPWLALGWADHARMLRARREPGDEARARVLLNQALTTFGQLGMDFHEHRVRALLGGDVSSPPGRSSLVQQGEYWTLVHEGREIRLRDSKGIRYLARLLRHAGRELHSLDLLAGPAGAPRTGSCEEALPVSSGDAGPVLDAAAKAAYRRRLAELEDELDSAGDDQEPAGAEGARAERSFLAAQLAGAVGLGGRDRPSASQVERARQSVTRAIRGTIEQIIAAHPALGAHLSATVLTGAFCCYQPDPCRPIRWEIDGIT